MAPSKPAVVRKRRGKTSESCKKLAVIAGGISKSRAAPSRTIRVPLSMETNPGQGTFNQGGGGSIELVKGIATRRTRLTLGGNEEPLALGLPAPTRKRIKTNVPQIELWAPKIPLESKLRKDIVRSVTSTMLWPDTSSLDAEATAFNHFIDYASQLSGWGSLQTKQFINSKFGAYYNCIVRYTDVKHRTLSLNGSRGNCTVFKYLQKQNVSVTTGVQDIRSYLSRFNLPLAVLVGEGQTWRRYPHCACIVFRFYNNKWEPIIKDCTNVDNKDVRPITRSILTALGFKTAYLVPLSKTESQRCSINCVGQGLHAAASILDGKLNDLCKSGPSTTIWQFDLENNRFLNNKLKGIQIVRQHLGILQPVKIIDSDEIRKKLYRFRQRVTIAGRELRNIRPDINNEMEYLVRSISNRRVNGPHLYYWVSWEGYGPEDDCWEPVENLESCKELVMEFDQWFESQLSDKKRNKKNRLTLMKAKPEWFKK